MIYHAVNSIIEPNSTDTYSRALQRNEKEPSPPRQNLETVPSSYNNYVAAATSCRV